MLRRRQACLPAVLVLFACVTIARASHAQTTLEEFFPSRTDHQKIVQSFGLRYFGMSVIPGPVNLLFPMAGGRFWFNHVMGVEAGIGAALLTTRANTWADFGAVMGIPLCFADTRHLTGLVRPFVSAFDISDRVVVQFGADIGVEWYLRYFGLPQVALEASFGVKSTVRDGKFQIDTSVGPWYHPLEIVAGMLSVTIYFAPG